jgi:type I restriction enzyme M protein
MNTGIPVVVLVINKAKREKGLVRFINAKKFVEDSSSREKRLNDYALNSVVRSSKESDALRIVSNDTIRNLGFNLNVPRYFQKEYEV